MKKFSKLLRVSVLICIAAQLRGLLPRRCNCCCGNSCCSCGFKARCCCFRVVAVLLLLRWRCCAGAAVPLL